MSTPQELVTLLREASNAYYNGGKELMDDDTYDNLLDRLRSMDPTNPYLEEIGAPPVGTTVALPFPMPSLDKIKPGQDALNRFLSLPGPFVISEKLDGISALWIPSSRSLYLRGDGIHGQDISHLVGKGIRGLIDAGPTAAIRGELVVPRALVKELGRSWVNGVIHRTTPSPEDLKRIEFVAYDVLKPIGLNRSQSFTWLKNQGYSVPFYEGSVRPTEDYLKTLLQFRRTASEFDNDGLVVAICDIPSRPAAGKNPKDVVAFKMPLQDQSAESTVLSVQWAASNQGYLIPRIEFEPVQIGAAMIRFCTGHNARTIVANRIAPGAKIFVRRSGDVIPTLDRVLRAAAEPSLPPPGTYEWVGADDATATHIRTSVDTPALIAAKLHHFFKTLEIPATGPATAAALVEAGLTNPGQILVAEPATLAKILGPKSGPALRSNLQSALTNPSLQELTLLLSSSKLPRGVGESKLKSLFALAPDPRTWLPWGAKSIPSGWTATSLEEFLRALPAYTQWRSVALPSVPYPLSGSAATATTAAATTAAATTAAATTNTGEMICMTGFRDKDLEKNVTAKGHQFSATFTKAVTVLLVADGPRKESEKTRAAAARGVPILTKSEFIAKYLP